MTDLFGFGKKPFSAQRPRYLAIIKPTGAYGRPEGMASVFNAPKGVYIAVHLQHLGRCKDRKIIFSLEDIDLIIPSWNDFAYLAFYTDKYSIHEVIFKKIYLKIFCENEESLTAACGTVLKY
ncbi:MAG: hypothetical protein IJG50_05710 [Clostridia bacterium]|nr:hypothetical protein [Clostridia bacterium]